MGEDSNKFEIDKQIVARQIEALRSGKVKLYSLEEAEKILDEALVDMLEHIGLAELISERKETPKESYILFEDVIMKIKPIERGIQ